MTDEIWKPIKDYEAWYEVSNMGRVRSLDRLRPIAYGKSYLRRGRPLVPVPDKDGYLEVKLSGDRADDKKRHKKVHRIVAEKFVENPDGLREINHKDLDKTNNAWTNLEWSTRKNNQRHASRMGRFHAVTNPKRAKSVSEFQVVAIRQMADRGHSLDEISASVGLRKHTVWGIVSGKSRSIPPTIEEQNLT